MLPSSYLNVLRRILPRQQALSTAGQLTGLVCLRHASFFHKKSKDPDRDQLSVAKPTPKELFQREFPDRFDRDGNYNSRIGHVDFIDDALFKIKELGLERDLEAYKELLRVFPPGKYIPTNFYDQFGMFAAPQQLVALRIMNQMEMFRVKPDKEVQRLVAQAFSVASHPWLKAARLTYWSMKGRNLDPNPLPEKLPEEPHKLAKIALARMSEDQLTIITSTNTSRLPESVDKTWLVYSQSPTQQAIIERLEPGKVLYVEEAGNTYVDDRYLTYFNLRHYLEPEEMEEKERIPEKEYDYNSVKMQFYGKPIKKKLQEIDDTFYIDGSYLVATAITGTSSQDSLLSWIKLLQARNPNLNKLSVIFRMSRKTPELVEYEPEQKQQTT